MNVRLLPLAGLMALALAAPASAAQRSVRVDDDFFQPVTVQINPGDSVRWNWVGSNEHTVTARRGQTERFDSGVKTTGAFRHTFPDRGRFTYHCEIHPGMDGVVEVGPRPFPDTKLPSVSSARARARGRTATVRFRLSERARVRVSLRGASSRSKTRTLGKGRRKLTFRNLRSGSYRATLRATDAAGNRSRRARTKRFRVG